MLTNKSSKHLIQFTFIETIIIIVLCSSFISIIHYHFQYLPLTLFLMFISISHIANSLVFSLVYSELVNMPPPSEIFAVLINVKNRLELLETIIGTLPEKPTKETENDSTT